MAFDAHANFAISTVATAPSPATSGTSLVVATGDGAKFPTAPFNAVIWPAGLSPLTANAEIVRVTAKSTDTLTITRTQESTSARTVVVGDQIMAAITAKTLTDVETVATAAVAALHPVQSGYWYDNLISEVARSNAGIPGAGFAFYVPWVAPASFTVNAIGITVTGAIAASNARCAIYTDSSGVPGTLLVDGGNMSTAATGFISATVSQAVVAGRLYWLATQTSAGITVRTPTASSSGQMVYGLANGNDSVGVIRAFNSMAFGAYPGTAPAVTRDSTTNPPIVSVKAA